MEQNVPPQLKAVGERMAGVVSRWWQKAFGELFLFGAGGAAPVDRIR